MSQQIPPCWRSAGNPRIPKHRGPRPGGRLPLRRGGAGLGVPAPGPAAPRLDSPRRRELGPKRKGRAEGAASAQRPRPIPSARTGTGLHRGSGDWGRRFPHPAKAPARQGFPSRPSALPSRPVKDMRYTTRQVRGAGIRGHPSYPRAPPPASPAARRQQRDGRPGRADGSEALTGSGWGAGGDREEPQHPARHLDHGGSLAARRPVFSYKPRWQARRRRRRRQQLRRRRWRRRNLPASRATSARRPAHRTPCQPAPSTRREWGRGVRGHERGGAERTPPSRRVPCYPRARSAPPLCAPDGRERARGGGA